MIRGFFEEGFPKYILGKQRNAINEKKEEYI
jgi:hypothetical protein